MKPLFGIIVFIIIGILTATVLGFGIPSSPPKVYDADQAGLDDRIVIKFSHVVAENTPKGLAAQMFADRVEEKSNGQIQVEVFPNGILYTDGVEIEALQRGDVQIIAPASSKISNMFPAWNLLDLPYAFPNHAAIQEAFEGKIGKQLFKKLEARNIKGLAFWINGFKQVTSNERPLIVPEDFRGQRFRIMPSEVLESQFTKMGVTTEIMSFNEVYRGLETGYLDGQENTISNIYSKRFYTVQKYMTLSNHGIIGYTVLMNGDFWNSLSDEHQDIITEAMNETTRWLSDNAIKMNQAQLERIKKESPIQIHVQTPEERNLWRKTLRSVYAEYESVIGKNLVEELRKIQNKYEEPF